MMANGMYVFNGIDAITGTYLLPPLPPADVARVALGEKLDEEHRRQLDWRNERRLFKSLGVQAGIDADDLAQAGWGVIFAHDADPAIRAALAPLLAHRQACAGSRYRLFWGEDGHRPEERSWDFLRRFRHAPAGPVDPERVPYYLLIVGEPEAIPYRFQYMLDAQFAVGRIAFDTPEEYAQYAQSVVRAETGGIAKPASAAFFGVRNAGDQATQMSADDLVAPLAKSFAEGHADWAVTQAVGAAASKARLSDLLGGRDAPRMLFSASHGMGFPCGDPLQFERQGALLCQDWPGPLQHRGAIPPDFYFCAEDVGDAADVAGMVAFLFACFGGGTPRLDDFSHAAFTQPGQIAPRAFVAALPKRLLAHPRGGALAVVAHVERAWGYSFAWPGVGPQLQVFESTLSRLASGHPIGHALEYFNDRYSQLAALLTTQIEDAKFQKNIDEFEIANTWTAHNDARSYVIVGDPAVRLA
ncbi:MAG: hypothetical protein Q7U73_13410 [Rubrivivax sp.]|nr:hypothetical protein [Rubrivivax sp.]